MAVVGTYRMGQRSLWVTVLIVNVYGVCIYLLDRWIGANYMYLTKKPGGSSLLDVLGPWPWYIASAEAITIASFLSFIGYIACSKSDTFLLYSTFCLKNIEE